MNACSSCGGNIRAQVLEHYDEDLLGIRVTIENAVVYEVCEECGEETYEIPDMEGLIAATAITRALVPVQLSGDEVRFVRKALGMKSKELAEALDISPEHYSRWENGHKGVGAHAEKVFRLYACDRLSGDAPAIHNWHHEIAKLRILNAEAVQMGPLMFRRVQLKACDDISTEWDRAA